MDKENVVRCKQCLTKAEPRDGLCPVCGVEQGKKFRALSPTEKKVRFHARGVRALGMFHVVAAGFSLLTLPYSPAPGPMAALAIINILLGFGLARFSLIIKKCAVTYYFLIGMVSVISIQHGSVYLGGIALCLVAIYLVGNGTARAIFERRVPDGI